MPAANFYEIYNSSKEDIKKICSSRLFTPFTVLIKASYDVRGRDFEGGTTVRYMAARVMPDDI